MFFSIHKLKPEQTLKYITAEVVQRTSPSQLIGVIEAPRDSQGGNGMRCCGRKHWKSTDLQVVIFFNVLRIVRYHLQTPDTNLGRFLLWVNDNL